MTLRIEGDAASLRRALQPRCLGYVVPGVRPQLLDYQLMALYALARQFDAEGARILEIGTGYGGSGYVLSTAAPRARILSLTVSEHERVRATQYWRAQGRQNISVQVEPSWRVLEREGGVWDFVWIDGDHNQIARDLPWFNRLRDGGLLLCHDYSPSDARCPSAIVYDQLNAMETGLGRMFDVRVVDTDKVGMAGFYRLPRETWPMPALSIPVPAPVRTPDTAGIVLRRDDADARRKAAALGLSLEVSQSWSTPWTRTLFVAPGVAIPWDLLAAGFHLVGRWDLAVPFTRQHVLAQAIGQAGDRERTLRVVRDLRVPVHAHELLFVGSSPVARECLARWRDECDGGDERLAFLRALATVKPRLCVLPRVWLADPSERAAIAATVRPVAPAAPVAPRAKPPTAPPRHRAVFARRLG